MNGLLQNLRSLGPARLGAIGAVLAGTIAFFVFLSSRIATPSYGLLYSDLEARDSGQIVDKLEAMNVPYQLKGDGSQILVPSDQVPRLRIAMAEAGLPHGGSVGYEIFDKTDTLGTSSFVQNINRLRALEGELARSIEAINAVETARVHLVLPQRELFARDKQEPSASIIVKTRGPAQLSKLQVAAIQHLVAAAVPGLRPGRISIVDSDGNLLARATEEGDALYSGMSSQEMRINYENRLARNVEELLDRSVGIGNVRVEVHADMDFDRTTTNSEKFDPDGQVVRSTQTTNETSDSSDGGDQPVSVSTNLPGGQNSAAAGAGTRSKNGRSEETTNYEITKTVQTQLHEGGVVKRLSVAVLVDGVTTTDADGKKTWKPRSADELKQLASLVRSAIGYDQKRGDTVDVVNLRFARPDELPAAPAPAGFLGFSRSELLGFAEPIILALVGFLILLLVVRPLVTRLLEAQPAPVPAPAPPPALAGPDAQRLLAGPGVAALGGGAPGAGMPAALFPPGTLEAADQMIDISQVEGRVRASSLKKIGEIVEKHPEEAVAIVRSWMYQNA